MSRHGEEDLDAETREKARLQAQLAEIWPVRNPGRYESEEELYGDVHGAFEANWDPPDERYYDVAQSAALLSRRMKEFNTAPYVFYWGEKGTGKSQALYLWQILCQNGLLTEDQSSAGIYQIVELVHPTLLFDETDSWAAGKSERTQALMPILNSGYRRNSRVIRASREGKVPTLYDTFGLKAIAGRKRLPETLMDRCIVQRMEQNAKDIPLEIDEDALAPLLGKLERYYVTYDLGRAPEGFPQPLPLYADPEELKRKIGNNRVTQLFYPLIAVCPSAKARDRLLDLAMEELEDRRAEEGTSDLAGIADAAYKLWSVNNPERNPKFVAIKDMSDIFTTVLQHEPPPGVKSVPSWMGRKLGTLGLKSAREAGGSRTRGVLLTPRKMDYLKRHYSLVSRSMPLGSGRSDTSVPSVPPHEGIERDPQIADQGGFPENLVEREPRGNRTTWDTSATSAAYWEKGTCRICQAEGEVRLAPDGVSLVCQLCSETRTLGETS